MKQSSQKKKKKHIPSPVRQHRGITTLAKSKPTDNAGEKHLQPGLRGEKAMERGMGGLEEEKTLTGKGFYLHRPPVH